MRTVLEFLVVFVIFILPQLLTSAFTLSDRAFMQRYSSWQRIPVNITGFSGTILLTLYIAVSHPESWAYIGLGFDGDWSLRLPLTTIAATLYMLFILYGSRARSKEKQQVIEQRKSEIFTAGAWGSYKSVNERLAFLLSLWLGVIAEDLVFRGYLIFGLQAQTGWLWPWVLLSVSLSVLAHIYQGLGWRQAFGHAALALIFIAVALLAQNVIAAIIPHLIYDTLWMLQGWSHMDRQVAQTLQSAQE